LKAGDDVVDGDDDDDSEDDEMLAGLNEGDTTVTGLLISRMPTSSSKSSLRSFQRETALSNVRVSGVDNVWSLTTTVVLYNGRSSFTAYLSFG
jgi:hypothetical protein